MSQRDWDDARLTNAAVDLHADDPEFGYRLIADELIAAGDQVSGNRVHRLCAQQRLCPRTPGNEAATAERGRRCMTTCRPGLHRTSRGREVVAALRNATARRPPRGSIVHSVRGGQFRSRKYVTALRMAGLVGSMGRVGACGDNAAVESSSRCCRRTFSTANNGTPATSYGWRS